MTKYQKDFACCLIMLCAGIIQMRGGSHIASAFSFTVFGLYLANLIDFWTLRKKVK